MFLFEHDFREFIMSKVICDSFSFFGEFEQLFVAYLGQSNGAFSCIEFVLFKNGLNKSSKKLQESPSLSHETLWIMDRCERY